MQVVMFIRSGISGGRVSILADRAAHKRISVGGHFFAGAALHRAANLYYWRASIHADAHGIIGDYFHRACGETTEPQNTVPQNTVLCTRARLKIRNNAYAHVRAL